jgi:Na+-transporting NADH:ubiquinone oxidoreductase subunit A
LALVSAKVRLDLDAEKIFLENILTDSSDKQAFEPAKDSSSLHQRLIELGVLPLFYDAFTLGVPDLSEASQAVLVSTLNLEPYLVRGSALLPGKISNLERAMQKLQSLLEYQQVYLILPDDDSELRRLVLKQIQGNDWIRIIYIPRVYPYDNFRIIARHIGLKRDAGSVWALSTDGVLAMDSALSEGKPVISKIISAAGPGAKNPGHINVPLGYPFRLLKEQYALNDSVRMINGAVFTGTAIDDDTVGVDVECRGITLLDEHKEREFLEFVRPGWDRKSIASCFLSALRRPFAERLTTAVRGEERPCVDCNFCEEVCAAGIMPYLIHKHLYADMLEEAQTARVDLCVECGLCTYVCPSKIDLAGQFKDAKLRIEQEKEEIRQEQLRQQEREKQEELRKQQNKEAQ